MKMLTLDHLKREEQPLVIGHMPLRETIDHIHTHCAKTRADYPLFGVLWILAHFLG